MGQPSMKPLVHVSSVWSCVLMACMVALACAMSQHSASGQGAQRLAGLRTIHVSPLEGGGRAEAMRQRIVERLKKSGRLTVVDNPSSADLILRGTASTWVAGTISLNPRSKAASETIYQGYLSVELVGREGQVIWSYLVTPSRFRTASIADDLADQIVAHLLAATESSAPGGLSPAAAGPESHVALRAAGGTFPAPLYRMWFQSSGLTVTYDAVGSAAGVEQLASGKVDFAASDMPLGSQNTPAGLRAVDFPTVLGGVVPIYNLPSLGRALRFTPEVLAGIYSGAIRKWNDPRILEVNHGAPLPDAEIAVVHRSDGSGTTYVWTSFLSEASPLWKAKAGSGARVEWPTGAGAAGNDGVAGQVERTPNSIGYVELIYAIQHELNYAAVRNPAGQFIKADLASITAAAYGTSMKDGSDFRFSILNSPTRDAYPISTFTWLVVPSQGLSAEKQSAIADLLNWALTSGQKQCSALGYAPLPREVIAKELDAVKAWQAGQEGNLP
jgi:phosphate ABC transporter phosphate-binding protein